MLDPKNIYNMITGLFAGPDDQDAIVVGRGIFPVMKIGFHAKKIEEARPMIANILYELEASEHPLIDLKYLLTKKTGEEWNHLLSMEDFHALDLLLACSDACGFIYNNAMVTIMNIAELGDASILISSLGKALFKSSEEWLTSIRENVLHKMYFPVDKEAIRKFASSKLEEKPKSQKRKP